MRNKFLKPAPTFSIIPIAKLARLLQRLAALHHAPLTVLYAVLPQELQVQSLLVGVKVFVWYHIRRGYRDY